MACEHIMPSRCPNGHDTSWKCHKPGPTTCAKCEKKAKDDAAKQQKAFEQQQKRDADQAAHARRMADLEEQVAAERVKLRDAQLAQERARAIQQKEKELQQSISLVTRGSRSVSTSGLPPAAQSSSGTNANVMSSQGPPTASMDGAVLSQSETEVTEPDDETPSAPLPKSSAQVEWEYMKSVQGVNNDAIDGIMEMIGLEAVKSKVLDIKAKIDTSKMQNTSMKDERVNIALLGNPGTGECICTVYSVPMI